MSHAKKPPSVLAACALAALVGASSPPWPVRAEEKPAEKEKPKPELKPHEAKLVALLENATLAGKWRLVAGGKLGKEAEDAYTIHSIEKVKDNIWIVKARIKYGEKDLTLPVPVEVNWAGDTPVLAVTDRGLPGLGTYTARVLFYDGYYTGTWSGPGHAGFLSGTIVKVGAPAAEKETAPPDAEKK